METIKEIFFTIFGIFNLFLIGGSILGILGLSFKHFLTFNDDYFGSLNKSNSLFGKLFSFYFKIVFVLTWLYIFVIGSKSLWELITPTLLS